MAEEWDKRLTPGSYAPDGAPGRRLAIAEAALTRMLALLRLTPLELTPAAVKQQAPHISQAQEQLQAALENVPARRWRLQLVRQPLAARLLRVFMDHLAAYARQCLADDLAAALALFSSPSAAGSDDRPARPDLLPAAAAAHAGKRCENDRCTMLDEHAGRSPRDVHEPDAVAVGRIVLGEHPRIGDHGRVVLPEANRTWSRPPQRSVDA